MSKVVAALTAAGGATAASVGGVYVLQKGSGTGTSQDAQRTGGEKGVSDPQPSTPKIIEFEDLQKFKDGKGGKCTTDLFGQSPEIDFSVENGTEPTEDTFFGAVPTDTGENTKGCLIINWQKKTGASPDNNGNGTFTWTGTFKNENKGFITFNVAKTHATEKKLELTGGFYLLEKDTASTPNKGIIKWKKEVTGGKELPSSNSDFETKFPKANSDFVFQLSEFTNKDYWGFMDGQDQLNKITGTIADASAPDPLVKKGSGTWTKDSGSKKVGEGSNDFEWGNYIYDKNTFDLSKNLESFIGAGTSNDTSVARQSS